MNLYVLLISAAMLSLTYFAIRANKARQLKYIEQYRFHKLTQKHQQLDMVFQGLRDYFRICQRARNRMASMPSQVIDDAWHEFILSIRIYEKFCIKAMRHFLHHPPAEAMSTPTLQKMALNDHGA